MEMSILSRRVKMIDRDRLKADSESEARTSKAYLEIYDVFKNCELSSCEAIYLLQLILNKELTYSNSKIKNDGIERFDHHA